MKPLSIRAAVWLLVACAAGVAAATGTYASIRLFPVARHVRSATVPLIELSSRLRDYDAWVERGTLLAQGAVDHPSPASLAALGPLLDRYDALAGVLHVAEVPDSVRVLLAEAGDAASRFAVTVEELRALLELGRGAEARQRLAVCTTLETRVRNLAAEAQARSLDRLLVAQREVESLSRRLTIAFLLWVLGSIAVWAATVRLVRSRVERPLRDLQDALARLGEGDLEAQVSPRVEDEIGALTRQFNQMSAVLRSRAEVQGQMAAASVLLADVAHEVNNPLMSISATVEQHLAEPSLPETLRRDLAEILRQARRASRLVSGIVRFVRPAAQASRNADVNFVVEEAVELLGFQFSADGVTCTFALADPPPRAAIDPQKLDQVLVALLANAHEALVRGGAARRSVEVRTDTAPGRVLVEVKDDGPGVAPEVRDRLFHPFAARERGRVSLGLFTARAVVREAGGELTYRAPENGRGATFVLDLPAGEPEAPVGPVRAPEREATLAGVRVLLVDDEPAVRHPLARFLTRRGAAVREAVDGTDALVATAHEAFDLIVADIRMPGLDGPGLYRALRDRDPAAARRMVFLSGDVASLGDLDPSGIAPSRILPKPVELAEFERFLLRHMEF